MLSVATATPAILAACLLALSESAEVQDKPATQPPRAVAATAATAASPSAAAIATTAAAPSVTPSTTSPVTPPQRLDLRAPDITKIFSAARLQQVLSKVNDPSIEEVEVEGRRSGQPLPPSTPIVWPGIFAPVWALMHPTQSWRIIAPLPPDQANRIGKETYDGTYPYPVIKIPQ